MKLRADNGKVDYIRAIFGVGIILVLIFLGWLVYVTLILDTPPAEITDTTVITKTVKQGDAFQYQVDFCKFSDTPVTIRRTWVDSLIYHTPAIKASILEIGCYEDLMVLVPVPDTLPPGIYELRTTLEYDTAHWTKKFVIYEVGPVEIVEGDK